MQRAKQRPARRKTRTDGLRIRSSPQTSAASVAFARAQPRSCRTCANMCQADAGYWWALKR
eukprot:11203407-Lingulodinium_polyedra.AAC.1